MARIDDRLIHQQVADGCCGSLPAKRLILAHDAVAADSVSRTVFRAAGPDSTPTEILPLTEAVRRLRQLDTAGGLESTIVVTETAEDMLRLVEAGIPVSTVTVGGMHRNPHRPDEIWAGFFVGPPERRALLQLQDRGIHVVFQTVPGAPGRALRELVEPPRRE
jgi:mannose/fructose/N-acetylgalactosamine-specific phosphotransferase system component IIB